VVAQLVPVERLNPPRRWGQGAGKIKMGDDFDGPLPDDILRHFQA